MTTTNMTPERLAEIEELSRIASQYRWGISSDFTITANPVDDLIVPLAELSDPHKAVCEIEGLFQAVPDLLAEVHRLQGELEEKDNYIADLVMGLTNGTLSKQYDISVIEAEVERQNQVYIDGKLEGLRTELAKVTKGRDAYMDIIAKLKAHSTFIVDALARGTNPRTDADKLVNSTMIKMMNGLLHFINKLEAAQQANAPTDIDWLIGEVERLKAEKAQAEAERDALAAELKENWQFLGGVMYAAAEMVTNGMDMTVPLEILMASGHWEEFEAHCNSCDVERFRQAVGEKCVNRLRRKPFSQQHAEKKGA